MARGARGMSKRASAKTWKASAGKIHKGNEPRENIQRNKERKLLNVESIQTYTRDRINRNYQRMWGNQRNNA